MVSACIRMHVRALMAHVSVHYEGVCLSLAFTLLGMTGSGAGMPPNEQSVIES